MGGVPQPDNSAGRFEAWEIRGSGWGRIGTHAL